MIHMEGGAESVGSYARERRGYHLIGNGNSNSNAGATGGRLAVRGLGRCDARRRSATTWPRMAEVVLGGGGGDEVGEVVTIIRC
jgi:hypothetical protein